MPGFVALSGDRVSTWFLQGLHILRLRLRPQDLPGDRRWTLLAGGCYVLAGTLLLALREFPAARLPFMLAVDLAVLLLFIGVALGLAGRGPRLPQTLQALLLAGTWFVLLALPTVPVRIDPEAETLSTPEALVAGYSLALMIWSIAVMAHVLRHALEWPLHRALALSLLYTVTNLLVHYGVFPVE
jgi:hypothetical protein